MFSHRLADRLGSGQFGEVFRGLWQSADGEVKVAVKTLKEDTGEEDRVKFLQEAAIMCQFKNPSVVKMHGVVTMGEPVSYCDIQTSKGSLVRVVQVLTFLPFLASSGNRTSH